MILLYGSQQNYDALAGKPGGQPAMTSEQVAAMHEHLGACDVRFPLYVLEHGHPQRTPAIGRTLQEPLNFALVGAQAQAEHIGADLAAHALALELVYQVQKHLVCNLGEGRPRAT